MTKKGLRKQLKRIARMNLAVGVIAMGMLVTESSSAIADSFTGKPNTYAGSTVSGNQNSQGIFAYNAAVSEWNRILTEQSPVKHSPDDKQKLENSEKGTRGTYTVTSNGDVGLGTLRQAIIDANANAGADIIEFTLGAGNTIILSSSLPTLTDDIEIDGSNTSGDNIILQGGGNASNFRAFYLNTAKTIDLNDMTITSFEFSSSDAGPAMLIYNGTLNMANCIVTNCKANNGNGGALRNHSGAMNIDNCTFENNYAKNDGGAISNAGTLTIHGSNFSSNGASSGAAIQNSGTGSIDQSSTVTNNSASFGGGAVFNHDGGTLNIQNCTITGNTEGDLNNSNGNVYLNAANSIGAVYTGSYMYNDGTLSSESVIISSGYSYPGELDNNNGASFTIAAGGRMDIDGNFNNKSGATFTLTEGASLKGNGSFTNNGTTNIKFKVSESIWHLISSPLPAATSAIFTGDFLQKWDEANARWDDIVPTTDVLTPGKGYGLWATPGKSDHIYNFAGTPNTGEQTIGMTSAGGGDNDGMNLLGNPYPSSIDWDVLDGNYGTVYYWDAANSRYATWSGSGSTNGGQQYLPPMQGFFVYTTAAKDFTINNNARTHENAASFYKGGSKEIQHGLRLEALAESGLKSDALLLFRENTQAGFDMQSDAWKIMSGTPGMPELYVKVENQKLALEARPETETIQLGFANDEAGIYKIDLKEIADIPNAFIEDTKTNTYFDLTKGAYEFAWNPETDLESRFKLHFKAVGIENNQISESNIRIYAADGQIFIKNGVETHGRASLHLTITDIMGRTVLQQTISASETTAIPVDLKKGVYVVMVGSGACSTALPLYKTEKVFIK